MRTVFMGSPDFAVPCFEVLAAVTQVVGVVCQPDKPAGRGLDLSPPPVKMAAQRAGVPVLQPLSLRPDKSDFLPQLQALRPDLIVVVAYGKILPPPVLAVPLLGCWNVHASILPRHRGAAPIQWALLCGDATTGVSLMQMDAGMDTGPVFFHRELAIAPTDTSGALHQALSHLGAELLGDGLGRLTAGTLPRPVGQDPAYATRAPMLTKEHGRIDFTRTMDQVSCQIRGVDPWPGAHVMLPRELLSAGPLAGKLTGDDVALKLFQPTRSTWRGRPGEVLGADRQGLHIACADGAVAIGQLQLPGRKRLPAGQVLSGFPLPRGTFLGDARNPRLDPAT